MRIYVNQMVTRGQKTGIGYYTSELVRCLRDIPGDHVIREFRHELIGRLHTAWLRVSRSEKGPGGRASLYGTVKGQVFKWIRSAGHYLLREYFRLALTRKAFDLYHEPNFLPTPTDVPTVLSIHDLSAVLHPEWHPPERIRRFEKYFLRGLPQCRHFFAISESARQEIIRVLNIAPQRITRTYMGVRAGLGRLPADDVRATLTRLGLPPQYLLCVGTIEPRKNVLRLMQAYCGLPAAVRDRWPLLLVGGWGWRTENIAEYYHREAKHRGVLHLGYVADEHVPAVYNGARALVYPSVYEGFGMPPIEMLACGGAVIASAIGPIIETVGSQAHLVHPEDIDGWREALLRVVSDDDWWLGLRKGGEKVARRFTWEQCAADTLRVYRRVLGREVQQPLPLAA